MHEIPKILKVSLVGISALFVMNVSLLGQDVEVKMEDGIPVVYNPKEPVYLPDTPLKLTLEEDLSLGEPDEEQNYPFSMLSWLCVDDDENMITVDNEEGCVRIFDKAGKLIRRFGRKGQGPGEFQNITFVSVFDGDKIRLIDPSNHRFSLYSLDGKCLEEVKLGEYWRVQRVKSDTRGFLYANFTTVNRVDEEVSFTVDLIKFDPDFQPVMNMGSFTQSRKRNEIDMVERRFGYDVRSDDVLVWGINTEYVLHFVDPEGKVIRKVVKDYDPERLTEEDRKRQYILSFGERELPPQIKLKYPKHFYPYGYLICDDEGRTYVRTYEKGNPEEYIFDVFDSQGRFIAKFARPVGEMPVVIKKRKMYTIRRDRNELPLMKRYAMIWE